MKKKKKDRELKKQQSQTAKQRKSIRKSNSEGSAAVVGEERKINKLIIFLASVIFLVIITVCAVVIPIWYYSGYRYEKNPIVVINLSNGMELKYEVFTSDAPFMSTGFLFLCKTGFFDGSIIYDTQNSWVRFGGYYIGEEDDFSHRSGDSAFLKKTESFFSTHAGEEQYKYRINKDKNVLTTINDESARYSLFGNHTNFCTDFQIMGQMGRPTGIIGESDKPDMAFDNVLRFAASYGEDTKSNIDSIVSLPRGEKYRKGYFRAPDAPFISIKSTAVYNYDTPYGRNFEDYMTNQGAFYSAWTGAYPAK